MVAQNTTYGIAGSTALRAPERYEIVKEESRTSTTTFSDSTALVCPVAASETLLWRCVLYVGGNSPGDAKVAFKTPASPAAGGMIMQVVSTGATVGLAFTAGVATTYNVLIAFLDAQGGADGVNVNIFEGHLLNGTTPGQLAVQFAQHTSDVAPSKFLVGSYLEIWRR